MIHLGHNRSWTTYVTTAVEEDVQGIAISSTRRPLEYFK